MKRADAIVIATIMVVILIGMVVACAPNIYRCEFDAWVDEDTVYYEYSSNYSMETHTALIHNDTDYDITEILVYFDEDFAAINDWELQEDMFTNLAAQLDARSSIGLTYCSSSELLQIMEFADIKSVAILIGSGAIADTIYDGTYDCPLIQWLVSGGTVISMSSCLGKYVSHGPDSEDIEEIEGYVELFTGVDGKSDSDFYDSAQSLRSSYSQNDLIQDSLGIQFNEYSYGINCEGMADYLSIGNTSMSGYSCAVLYKSYSGMVMNFGMTITNQSHTVHFVAQTIAAGLDYTSNVIDYSTGHTSDSPSGSFDISDKGGCHVYGYVGSARAVFGQKVNL